jgi:hypothetical protein
VRRRCKCCAFHGRARSRLLRLPSSYEPKLAVSVCKSAPAVGHSASYNTLTNGVPCSRRAILRLHSRSLKYGDLAACPEISGFAECCSPTQQCLPMAANRDATSVRHSRNHRTQLNRYGELCTASISAGTFDTPEEDVQVQLCETSWVYQSQWLT